MPDSGDSVLRGIRILDFSWVLAGPYATRLLADFGAEVIKIQPLLPEAEDKFSQGYYNTWNRNKLGITLNLGRPEGLEIARRLIALCDAVVENFSPRVMPNWGLDYPELKKINPQIILLSMSAMGHSGPWRDYAGFGPSVQAFSGITRLTAYPGGLPLGIGFSYADHIAGLYASLALLNALEYLRQTGEGQYIDLSQTETMTGLLADAIIESTIRGKETGPVGNRSSESAPYGIYSCKGEDRWCAVSVTSPEEWEGLKLALGYPSWTDEKRFASLSGRLENIDDLDSYIQDWMWEHSAEEAMTTLLRAGVPSGVVQNAADLADDPQFRSRGFFYEAEHPALGRTIMDASPIHLSHNPAEYRRAAPSRGQDNGYIYSQLLGLSDDEISRLKTEGII